MPVNHTGPAATWQLDSEPNESPFFGILIVFDGQKPPKFGE